MQLQEKALYNLLRLRWLRDQSLDVKPWQVEDYRQISEEELFARLQALGLNLDQVNFLSYVENILTPEELVEVFWTKEGDPEGRDQAYLCLFELWRRHAPEKQSLTIFCDELDYQISLYDEDQADEEVLEALLADLSDILDQHVDEGEDPKKIFQGLSSCCAHDLERFLYDYIMDLIDEGEETYGSELIDAFFEYLSDTKGFEFLRIRLFSETDVHESARLLHRLVERLREEPDFELLLEMASFMVSFGEDSLFRESVALLLTWMQVEEDFHEILYVLQDYYSCLDQDDKEEVVASILEKRSRYDLGGAISKSDPDLEKIKSIIRFS